MTTGGIAGVASNYKGTSIKLYGGRQKYQEWEFIFSLNNQQNGAGAESESVAAGGERADATEPAEWDESGADWVDDRAGESYGE